MKRTEIHLSDPFKEVLASLLTLPSTHTETDDVPFSGAADSVLGESAKCDAEVKEALRSVYEAAHGRQVEGQGGDRGRRGLERAGLGQRQVHRRHLRPRGCQGFMRRSQARRG